MTGFTPPPLVWETLGDVRAEAERFPGGAIDLTIGTPTDPPPPAVVAALGGSGAGAGLPAVDRHAAAPAGRVGLDGPPARRHRAGRPGRGHRRARRSWSPACRSGCGCAAPDRDTVLYPAISYPTYAMGATLASVRSVAGAGHRRPAPSTSPPSTADDAARALCLWRTRPGNPTGALDDLGAAAAWGRSHGVPGAERRVLRRAHLGRAGPHDPRARRRRACSPSTRSRSGRTWPGCGAASTRATPTSSASSPRCASTPGSWCPGPVQAAATVALADDVHVDEQRARYRRRLDVMLEALRRCGFAVELPGGAFYLWVPAADGDGAALTRWFAEPGRAARHPRRDLRARRRRLRPPRPGPARRGHRPGRGAPRRGGRRHRMTGRGGRAPGMMGR